MVRRRWCGTSSTSRRVLRTVAAGAILCVPAQAHAEVEPIALSYEASNACPPEPDFVAAVQSHTRRWSRVPIGTPAVRTVRVRMQAGRTKATGRLEVENRDGAVSERDITGPGCAEVAEALAVMVAVAIDPRAGTPDGPAETQEGPPEPKPPITEPKAEPPAPPRSAPVRVDARKNDTRTARRDSRPDEGLRIAFDLRAETTSAVIRGGLHGFGASVTLTPPPATSPRRELAISGPSLGLGIRQCRRGSFAVPRGEHWGVAGIGAGLRRGAGPLDVLVRPRGIALGGGAPLEGLLSELDPDGDHAVLPAAVRAGERGARRQRPSVWCPRRSRDWPEDVKV
ncbi:MAG: hypothetical protein K0S65_6100 [Labilithrix sp.]|nr:hypothetical protein [Labilithrix sp.]